MLPCRWPTPAGGARNDRPPTCCGGVPVGALKRSPGRSPAPKAGQWGCKGTAVTVLARVDFSPLVKFNFLARPLCTANGERATWTVVSLHTVHLCTAPSVQVAQSPCSARLSHPLPPRRASPSAAICAPTASACAAATLAWAGALRPMMWPQLWLTPQLELPASAQAPFLTRLTSQGE